LATTCPPAQVKEIWFQGIIIQNYVLYRLLPLSLRKSNHGPCGSC